MIKKHRSWVFVFAMSLLFSLIPVIGFSQSQQSLDELKIIVDGYQKQIDTIVTQADETIAQYKSVIETEKEKMLLQVAQYETNKIKAQDDFIKATKNAYLQMQVTDTQLKTEYNQHLSNMTTYSGNIHTVINLIKLHQAEEVDKLFNLKDIKEAIVKIERLLGNNNGPLHKLMNEYDNAGKKNKDSNRSEILKQIFEILDSTLARVVAEEQTQAANRANQLTNLLPNYEVFQMELKTNLEKELKAYDDLISKAKTDFENLKTQYDVMINDTEKHLTEEIARINEIINDLISQANSQTNN